MNRRLSSHHKVGEAYHALSEREPERVKLIEGDAAVEVVAARVWDAVLAVFPRAYVKIADMARFTCGLLMNQLHTFPVRRFSALSRVMPTSMPITSRSVQPLVG